MRFWVVNRLVAQWTTVALDALIDDYFSNRSHVYSAMHVYLHKSLHGSIVIRDSNARKYAFFHFLLHISPLSIFVEVSQTVITSLWWYPPCSICRLTGLDWNCAETKKWNTMDHCTGAALFFLSIIFFQGASTQGEWSTLVLHFGKGVSSVYVENLADV